LPGQRLKVTDDMRLLEVARLVCERYPVDVVRDSDAIDDRSGVAGSSSIGFARRRSKVSTTATRCASPPAPRVIAEACRVFQGTDAPILLQSASYSRSLP
jgi:hypothetical protein